ncbi:MAG: hypothetical protein FWF96_07320 [Kiritimatiellaeota bacterium]|nr:hypothetical protein [Kiritimatiellota bacterium]
MWFPCEGRAATLAEVNDSNDPVFLAEVAKNDEDVYVRLTAVEKLDDQAVLAGIAKNDEDWQVRLAAKERLAELERVKR